MTPTEPNVAPSGRYSVTLTAAALEIDRKTINNWCKEGKIAYHLHRINGRKFFYGSEILRVWKAYL